jgi:hypothetical protein
MKKIGIIIICLGMFIISLGVLGHFEHRYIRKNCEIITVENDKITVEDELGYLWTFEGDGFEKGEKVNLKMFDSCTGTMEDDVIEGVERVD